MSTPTFPDAYKALEAAKAAAEEAAATGARTGNIAVMKLAGERVVKASAEFREAFNQEYIEIDGKGNLLRTEHATLAKLASDNRISLGQLLGKIDLRHGRVTGANFRKFGLVNISSLAGLTELRRIDLGQNRISDISALSPLTRLVWLMLDNNLIIDISVLKDMQGLLEVDFNKNPIEKDVRYAQIVTSLRTRAERCVVFE